MRSMEQVIAMADESMAAYRLAKHDLFAAIHEQKMGASEMELVEAIEKLVFAAITRAFLTHPITRHCKEPDSADEHPQG